MIVTGSMVGVYGVGMASAALFWDNLPEHWKTLLMAVPDNFDANQPFLNW